ncbi:MAG: hypothetical protein PHH98_00290 [Candidatus Gracilibacteria bacterium]|nr:hypothetical protein [Candidatus Gracilibacteria bacterium]
MNQFKILFTIFISSMFMSSAYAATIENIQAVDNQTVKVAVSSDVTFSDVKVYGDVKILRDIEISSATKDPSNSKKVTLNLASDLVANSSYSLIGVIGAEGNIDFDIGKTVSGEITNTNTYNETKIIEKISIVNSKTIDVYYNYDIAEGLFEFKLLSDLTVESLYSKGNNILDVNLSTTMEKSSSYILMISNLENIDGVVLDFAESLYDFTTNSSLVEKSASEENITDVIAENSGALNSNIEEVSLKAAKTPEAGAETWFVMLLTFLLSSFYFFRNKLSK